MQRLGAALGVLATLWAAGAQAAPADRRIGRGGVGPVRLGMTVAAARRVLRGLKVERTSDGDGVALIAVRRGATTLMVLYAGEADPSAKIKEKARIELIEALSPQYETAAGVRPGMLLRDVERRYGRLKRIEWSEIESREWATFTRQPDGMSFRVLGKDENAGVYGKNVGPPAKTTRYSPGARVAGITVRK